MKRVTDRAGLVRACLLLAAAALGSCSIGTVLDASGIADPDSGWVMIACLSGDGELAARLADDLNELEAAKPPPWLRILALLDVGIARLYAVRHDPAGASIVSEAVRAPELGLDIDGAAINTGDAAMIAALLDVAQRIYPGRRIALVLGGRSAGYRGALIDPGSGDTLWSSELATAIRGHGVDVVAVDSSFGAAVELAYEIRGEASVMIASQNHAPDNGWPFDLFIEALSSVLPGGAPSGSTAGSGAGFAPADFAHAAVTAYAAGHAGSDSATISAVDLTRLPPVVDALDLLSDSLFSWIGGHGSNAPQARGAVRSALFYDVEEFYATPGDLAIDLGDLADVARALVSAAGDPPGSAEGPDATAAAADVHAAAGALSAAVRDAVIASWAAPANARAHGLSVHLIPLLADGTAAPTHTGDYFRGMESGHRLAFVARSAWVPAPLSGTGLLYRLFYEQMQTDGAAIRQAAW